MAARLWFKIGEAARLAGATPKELRYWEKLLPEIQPRRSRGNLRYYHIDEIPRLKAIRQWLDEGFTVLDCRALLQGEAPRIPVLPEGLAGVARALRALHARLARPLVRPAVPQEAPARPRKPRPPAPEPVRSDQGAWSGGLLPLDLAEGPEG